MRILKEWFNKEPLTKDVKEAKYVQCKDKQRVIYRPIQKIVIGNKREKIKG